MAKRFIRRLYDIDAPMKTFNYNISAWIEINIYEVDSVEVAHATIECGGKTLECPVVPTSIFRNEYRLAGMCLMRATWMLKHMPQKASTIELISILEENTKELMTDD